MIDWVSSLMAITLFVTHLSSSYPSCPDSCHCYRDTGMLAANCSSLPSSSENIEILNLVRQHSNPLQLNDGQFTGFKKLKYLNLRNCSVELVHKKAFFGVNSLVELDLSHNNIEFLDSTVFQQIDSLSSVVLRGNNFKSFSDPFIISESVEYLDLGQCGIAGIPLGFFHGLTQLKYLALDKNSLTTLVYNSLPKSLRYLNLSHNLIIDVPTVSLVKLRNLRRLDLSGNPVNCTCPLMNLQDHLSGLGVVFEHEVICSSPPEYAGLSWSKVNENELCIEESLFSGHLPIKSQKHKQKYEYQIHRKPDVNLREMNFDPYLQADQPYEEQLKHDPDSEVLFQNDETRSYGAMMNQEITETDLKDSESDKKTEKVVENNVNESDVKIETFIETTTNIYDEGNNNEIKTEAENPNKEEPTFVEQNTDTVVNIMNDDSKIESVTTDKIEENVGDIVATNLHDKIQNEIFFDKKADHEDLDVTTIATENVEKDENENKHKNIRDNGENIEIEKETQDQVEENSKLVKDEEKLNTTTINENEENKHESKDLHNNKESDQTLGEIDSLLEDVKTDVPKTNIEETTKLVQTNEEQITSMEGILHGNVREQTELPGNVGESKVEEITTENDVEVINKNGTENVGSMDLGMLGDLTQENGTESVNDENTEKLPVDEKVIVASESQKNENDNREIEKDITTEHSNVVDETLLNTELPPVDIDKANAELIIPETTTQQDSMTTLLSEVDANKVEYNNTDIEVVTDHVITSTLISEVTTTASPLLPDNINGSTDVDIPSNAEVEIDELTTTVTPSDVNAVTEMATEVVLPEESTVNASAVLNNIKQDEVIEDDGLIGDKTLKEMLPFEFESAHVVLGCILVLITVLVLFAFYKCTTEGKKSSRRLKDVESNHGTEMQDMASLIPKPKSEEPKIISKKYPDDAPNGENVSLIHDEKKENVETKPTQENKNINNNTTQNKPSNTLMIDPSSPIQRTRVKVGIIPDSIPRTPIFVQKSINNGVTNG